MRIYSFTNRVVIDTNIIVSALISPNGSSAKFMADVFDQKYEVVITEQILTEYTEVLHRDKFQIEEDIIQFVISWFSANSLFVEIDEDSGAAVKQSWAPFTPDSAEETMS